MTIWTSREKEKGESKYVFYSHNYIRYTFDQWYTKLKEKKKYIEDEILHIVWQM